MQHLIEYEVYHKRQMAMMYIAKGLNHYNLLPLIKRNVPGIVQYILGARKFNVRKILSKVKCEMMDNEVKENTYTLFKKYLNARNGM